LAIDCQVREDIQWALELLDTKKKKAAKLQAEEERKRMEILEKRNSTA